MAGGRVSIKGRPGLRDIPLYEASRPQRFSLVPRVLVLLTTLPLPPVSLKCLDSYSYPWGPHPLPLVTLARLPSS